VSDLPKRLAAGEESAYDELYDACADQLYGYVRHRLGDPDAAAEVLQETFLRLVRHGRWLKRVRDLDSYVFGIARNEANRWLRRKRPVVQFDGDVTGEVPPEQKLDQAEQLQVAMTDLDDLSRDIVQMKVHGELTFKTIAGALDLPPGTVASRYRRALQHLRVVLGSDRDE